MLKKDKDFLVREYLAKNKVQGASPASLEILNKYSHFDIKIANEVLKHVEGRIDKSHIKSE